MGHGSVLTSGQRGEKRIKKFDIFWWWDVVSKCGKKKWGI
jgi:hypothetical protein